MGDHDGLESVITIGWNTHSPSAHFRKKRAYPRACLP
jgi:hypothetical protein